MIVLGLILGIFAVILAIWFGRWHKALWLDRALLYVPLAYMNPAIRLIFWLVFIGAILGFIAITRSLYYCVGLVIVVVIAYLLGGFQCQQRAIREQMEYLMREDTNLDETTALEQAKRNVVGTRIMRDKVFKR